MKKLLLLLPFLLFVVSCGNIKIENAKNTKTILKVINQSSVALNKAEYSGLQFRIAKKPSNNGEISIGGVAFCEFNDEVHSYIRFTVVVRDKEHRLKLNELISIEKGKEKTIIITDNTLVLEEGGSESFPIANFFKVAKLTIQNNSAYILSKVLYKDVEFQDDDDSGGSHNIRLGMSASKIFFDGVVGYVNFEIVANNKTYKLKVNELVSIKKGEEKVVSITNETLVIEEGAIKAEALSNVLMIAKLTIQNETSHILTEVKYKDVLFYDDSSESNRNILPGRSSSRIFIDNVASYIYFSINSNNKTYKLKVNELVSIKKGEEKTIIISNDTIVMKEGAIRAEPISSVLRSSKLTIKNESSYPLYRVRYGNTVVEKIGVGDIAILDIFETINDYVFVDKMYNNILELDCDSILGDLVKEIAFKSENRLEVNNEQNSTFTIKNDSMVVVSGEFQAVTLSSLVNSEKLGYLVITNDELPKHNLRYSTATLPLLEANKKWIIGVAEEITSSLYFSVMHKDNKLYKYASKEDIAVNKTQTKYFALSNSNYERKEYNIGEEGSGGGIVFYFSEAGFTVQDGQGGEKFCHYLEVSKNSLGKSMWHPYENNGEIKTASGLGCGKANTYSILNYKQDKLNISNCAAYRCQQFYTTTTSKGEWFLPSKDELGLLLDSRIFSNNDYYTVWSSTDRNSGSAYYGDIYRNRIGDDYYSHKSSRYVVFAIRAF